jgi:hypothetical protein
MSYSHATFRAYITGFGVTQSFVSAFEYAMQWEKGGDADVAFALICSQTTSTADTASSKTFNAFSKNYNTSTS